MADESSDAPRVRVLLTMVEDADLDAALAIVGRQVYEPTPELVVVGVADGEVPEGVTRIAVLEDAIRATGPEIDYLWLLHADARPRPDALSALVSEIERNDAALAGSKLLKAGTMDELESVGGATDVFGEPYSGLDEGEIDLQQYDVVREVAFVTSASMLVRRDLAQGLKGLDPLLPPVASGLDFSQRARLAGGKVISVPSSEVYHQGRCGEGMMGWREQAGRLRAMVTAYSPLTLLWVLPYDLLVSIVDSLASLLLLRWRPLLRHVFSFAWNTAHLPSTIRQRRRFRSVRSAGDVELFRFQARGSIRLRSIVEEVSGRALSFFDDDQPLARGTRRVWRAPGIWGAIVAVLVAFIGARSLIFTGMPDTGFTFPFETPSVALQRWFAGWNDSGLGSTSPVHPSVGLTGLVSLIWFGAEGAARTLLTIAFSAVGVIGMGRLAGRVGLRGPGRYLAGLVMIAGPGTAVLTARGSWLGLGGAALLPWAVRAAFTHARERGKSRLTRVGWALLTGTLVAFLSPLLVLVPLVTVLIWRLVGGTRGSSLIALCGIGGVLVSASFLLGDPGWITDDTRRLGLTAEAVWPVFVLVAAAPFYFAEGNTRSLGLTGGLISLGSLVANLAPGTGPGVEEALLVTTSFGAALVVAAALDTLSRRIPQLVSAGAAVVILALSVGVVANGRLGLDEGDINERLSFAATLADESGPGRILHAAIDPSLISGEVRAGPGFFFRVVDGRGTTHDEVWLPEPESGDDVLLEALTDISTGEELRPGARLAQFAIDWVVLEGPSFRLDDALLAQLDLVPTPLDPNARVFENRNAGPIAGNENLTWTRSGAGFVGDTSEQPVRLAINFDDGWQRGAVPSSWSVLVDGSTGTASFRPSGTELALAIASMAIVAGAITAIALGRRRR